MPPPLLFRSAALRFTKGGAARLWFLEGKEGNSNCCSRERIIVAEQAVNQGRPGGGRSDRQLAGIGGNRRFFSAEQKASAGHRRGSGSLRAARILDSIAEPQACLRVAEHRRRSTAGIQSISCFGRRKSLSEEQGAGAGDGVAGGPDRERRWWIRGSRGKPRTRRDAIGLGSHGNTEAFSVAMTARPEKVTADRTSTMRLATPGTTTKNSEGS